MRFLHLSAYVSMSTIQELLDSVQVWVVEREDIQALALVGSHARGTNRPDSDVDFVVLTSNLHSYPQNIEWASRFGSVSKHQTEDYGDLTSVRVWYSNGLEVEYGFALPEWAESVGGRAVLATGVRVMVDKRGVL